ncbi:DUF2189 domain-containing protein [Sulfuricystis thermophila]|uniref:DUF2189 domain-containing protein n=1 Tax=Sulfuricystis thermophila TaxID=2496847 RepID=UPI001036C953|nr:DUF2189 domain-containing protein [Sulfuricystis thermophila]
MTPRPFGFADIGRALAEGWSMTKATRAASLAYAGIFTLLGAIILGGLLLEGFTPFVVAAAGAFMLVGPAILAGFFGIARACEAGAKVGAGETARGFAAAAPALWALALVCALLFMIFVTDAAILYSYMVGGTPVWLADLIPTSAGVANFLFWGAVSGFVIAFLLYCVSAFSAPLLIERRAGLVDAVVASVHAVFGNFLPAMAWAALLSVLVIGSILILPLLPLTLPWLAYASRALYRHVMP